MMLGEESRSADYWKQCGDEAIKQGVKGIIMMGAHWDVTGDKIQVATNPNPNKSPVAYVHPSKYVDWKLNPDIKTSERCIQMLRDRGIDAERNDKFDWIHDTFLIFIRMFPDASTCPPCTIVSMNARYDPHMHVKIGATLRPLRQEGYLIIGSGGAVHNLYRNQWTPMLRYRDNFGMIGPPEKWALTFRQSFEDAVTKNSGPELRRAVTRLMKHPQYRDAHATDDHFMSALFVASAIGDEEDVGSIGVLHAEDWELTNMCNSQFTFGSYVAAGA